LNGAVHPPWCLVLPLAVWNCSRQRPCQGSRDGMEGTLLRRGMTLGNNHHQMLAHGWAGSSSYEKHG